MNVVNKIVDWLVDYSNNSKTDGFVVGVSGGIDSAVTSTLCAMTTKPTVVVSLPIHSHKYQFKLAYDHINWLIEKYPNVSPQGIDLTEVFDSFKEKFSSTSYVSDLAFANSKSRLRMIALYQIATSKNLLVVGTGNKVEDFGVGFYTKYGDGGVDISPIADLYKTEVRDIGKFLGVSREIITAHPTDGLWDDDRTDEDQIGATYEELEECMKILCTPEDHLTKRQVEVRKIYLSFNNKNKHKMLPIPIFNAGDNNGK